MGWNDGCQAVHLEIHGSSSFNVHFERCRERLRQGVLGNRKRWSTGPGSRGCSQFRWHRAFICVYGHVGVSFSPSGAEKSGHAEFGNPRPYGTAKRTLRTYIGCTVGFGTTTKSTYTTAARGLERKPQEHSDCARCIAVQEAAGLPAQHACGISDGKAPVRSLRRRR